MRPQSSPGAIRFTDLKPRLGIVALHAQPFVLMAQPSDLRSLVRRHRRRLRGRAPRRRCRLLPEFIYPAPKHRAGWIEFLGHRRDRPTARHHQLDRLALVYAKHRGGAGGARRDLENLRAAINHHARQNLHRAVITVTLPPKGRARDRWLERSEAARLLWAAWRHREEQTIHRGKNKGIKIKTGKYTLRHLARFVLIGLYTGTRAAAIAAASPKREEGRAYVDLRAGIYYRLARGKRATNKRQPPAPLPDRLLAHMRRWVDKKIITTCFVEWNGKPVKSVKNAFARAVEVAGLDLTDGNVTAHTLRHTAATWLMQRGVDPWEAAGFLGMSVKVLIETYGHHHPNHMRGAADAITRKARTPSVLSARSADRLRTG